MSETIGEFYDRLPEDGWIKAYGVRFKKVPSTPNTPTYPDVHVKLSGTDGNAFSVTALVAGALRRQVSAEAARNFAIEAMDQEGYDSLLRLVMKTVNVT